jgi:hypothetical protein
LHLRPANRPRASHSRAGRPSRDSACRAIRSGGGALAGIDAAADAIVWLDPAIWTACDARSPRARPAGRAVTAADCHLSRGGCRTSRGQQLAEAVLGAHGAQRPTAGDGTTDNVKP